MKLCMISGYANYFGGVENVVNELNKFLLARQISITVFTESNRDRVSSNGGLVSVEVRPYLIPRALQVAYYDKVAYDLKSWRKILHFGPFDIVHGHSDNCLFYAMFRKATPFILTVHGTRAKVLPRDPRAMPDVYAEKVAAKKCDIAVACSFAVKQEMVDLYDIEPKKILVIHNGVDIQKFTPKPKIQARQALKLPLNGKYALWVGRDPVRKGLWTAINTVSEFPDLHLLVVGLEGENFKNVVFLGKLSQDNLVNAFNAADVLLFPTLYEGFPVASLEALACGLPMIVSAESNMGEIITPGIQGFVVSNRNQQVYREKLKLILRDSQNLESMSRSCRQLALKYSWENQAQKYLNLYQKLLR